ncbi:RNA 2',3'-cyclic phosphodiesterase, partial [bacterium (Candidatus Moisslbacteria) CG_4_9_14_0_8_um_filter_36_20]
MKIRSFIAVNLPEEIKEEIKKIIDILGQSGNGVKWVEPRNLHLTLHFLGWLEEEKIEDVKKILSEATKGLDPCFMKI